MDRGHMEETRNLRLSALCQHSIFFVPLAPLMLLLKLLRMNGEEVYGASACNVSLETVMLINNVLVETFSFHLLLAILEFLVTFLSGFSYLILARCTISVAIIIRGWDKNRWKILDIYIFEIQNVLRFVNGWVGKLFIILLRIYIFAIGSNVIIDF